MHSENKYVSDNPKEELFAPIATKPLSGAAIGLSLCLHAIFGVLLLWIPLSIAIQEPERTVFVSPLLLTPSLIAPLQPQPAAKAPNRMSSPDRETSKPLPTPPKPEPTTESPPNQEESRPVPSPPPAPPLAAAAMPKQLPRVQPPAPKLGGFPGMPAAAALNTPQRNVQIGGFGIPAESTSPRGSSDFVARVGSFDAPPGSGQGNGSGHGRGGLGGTVAGAGFGSAVAEPGSIRGNGRTGSEGSVRRSGFDDLGAAPQLASGGAARPVEAKPSSVEITFKPRPTYTEEARKLGLEGDVVLEVLFAASGELRVLQVIRGLGHGLDEAAIRAAEQIRFKPAQRDGRAVDARTTIRIIFRLA